MNALFYSQFGATEELADAWVASVLRPLGSSARDAFSLLEESSVIALAQIQYLVVLLTSVVHRARKRRCTTYVVDACANYDMKTSLRMPVTLCVNQI
jgi:hypothetical protein